MKTTTFKGTNDYMPEETLLRDYLLNKILDVYRSAGFSRITTPVIESIENLEKSDGGDNLNLIFKIMKRGDKLKKALENGNFDSIADCGLRYDLTLPLVRYYSNNKENLPNPFKVIQADRVYRAERPQKGRLCEFMQCDIDIIGTKSETAEIELIHTTAKALLEIGISDFKIRINDRRILKNILIYSGFEKDKLDTVCVTFDKLDKIGIDGIKEELFNKGFDGNVINKFIQFLTGDGITLESVKICVENIHLADTLKKIIDISNELSGGKYSVYYDASLVRGQGYYTGTVFEISCDEFGGSVGGGGRYDNMVGSFLGQDIPAVGFSIGFERIFSILSERGNNNYAKKKVAVLYDENEIKDAILYRESLKDYDAGLFIKSKKIGKQFENLAKNGYYAAIFLNDTDNWKIFK